MLPLYILIGKRVCDVGVLIKSCAREMYMIQFTIYKVHLTFTWPKLTQAIINRNKVIGSDNPAGLNLRIYGFRDPTLGLRPRRSQSGRSELAARRTEVGARARAGAALSDTIESRDPGAGPSLVPAYFRDIQRWKVGKVVFFIHYDTRHSQSPKHTL